jgi:hypothetical protein
VTQTGGSGTYRFWWIATKPDTTIINNCAGASMIQVQQPDSASVEISGVQTVGVASNSYAISISASTYSGPKTLVHDCWFETQSGSFAIKTSTNRGLAWSCSFDDTFSMNALAFQMKSEGPEMEPSWSTASTWGADDTNGATNFYIEDCDFHAYLMATDFDSNTRAVFRHNVIDNCGMGSHGADSGPLGMRHVEIYDNELIFNNMGDCDGSVTLNVDQFLWQRGGSMVITDNILPNIDSCAYPHKGNINMSILNLTRSISCYGCWIDYPAPHQVGQGFGTGAVRHDFPCNQGNYGYYYIYSEPDYIWNNTGTAGNRVGLKSENPISCTNPPPLSQFIQAGRDYIIGPKPGYQKFTYPHPLRGAAPSPTPTPTATATPQPTSTPSTTATPTATATPRPTATPGHTPRPHPSHGPVKE